MRSFRVATLAPLAIFFAALIANHRAATSLLVWSDTIYEQSHVDRCLTDDQCTLIGTQTSIRGLFHAVAWLDVRTLLAWLGVGPTGLLRVIQVLNALAATIVFQLAARLGGLLAGGVAAAVLVFGISPGFSLDGVHNLSLLSFLGAVLTVACTAVVQAPGIVTVVLAALVAALMANVHIVCIVHRRVRRVERTRRAAAAIRPGGRRDHGLLRGDGRVRTAVVAAEPPGRARSAEHPAPRRAPARQGHGGRLVDTARDRDLGRLTGRRARRRGSRRAARRSARSPSSSRRSRPS